MTLYQRMRFARGLRWKTSNPPIPWREIAIVCACCLVYGLVAKIDALGDRAAFMERAAEIEGASADVLRACEKGASGYRYSDGRSYECSRPL